MGNITTNWRIRHLLSFTFGSNQVYDSIESAVNDKFEDIVLLSSFDLLKSTAIVSGEIVVFQT